MDTTTPNLSALLLQEMCADASSIETNLAHLRNALRTQAMPPNCANAAGATHACWLLMSVVAAELRQAVKEAAPPTAQEPRQSTQSEGGASEVGRTADLAAAVTPEPLPTAPKPWDEAETARLAEVAMMEGDVAAALQVLNESVPHEVDAGVYYDNARRRQDVILRLLETDIAKGIADVRRRLERALESARYVGD